jgi:Ca2+-binding RTX toxin-like protein
MIAGTSDRDLLTGTTGNDEIYGYSGNDTLYGNDGNDTVDGGLGWDSIYGGNGDDILTDDVSASSINYLDGGNGYDVVKLSNVYHATLEDDQLDVIPNTPNIWLGKLFNIEAVYLSGTSGNDTINGSSFSSQVTLEGLDGNDSLAGGSSSDYLSGGSGNDTVSGNSGNDILLGGNDTDNLTGGDGADTLTGGNGNDTMTGGAGNDVFQLSASLSFNFSSFSFKWSTSGSDVIKDFGTGDTIQIDTNALGLAAKSDFKFQNGKLYAGNNVLATLEGVTSFNVNNIQFI